MIWRSEIGNNDGKLDVVATNFNDKTLSIRLGNGNGTFSKHQHVEHQRRSHRRADLGSECRQEPRHCGGQSDCGNASIFLGDETGVFGNPLR